jgi:hypothetical protein
MAVRTRRTLVNIFNRIRFPENGGFAKRAALLTATILIVAVVSTGFMLVPPRASAMPLPTPTGSTYVTNDEVFAIVNSSGTTYIGGKFTQVGLVGGTMQDRNHIAAIYAATGAATSWDPNANDWVRAFAVSPDGSTVYAGGDFTSIGGQARSCIAAIDATTGLATTWNPNASGEIPEVCALAVSPDGSTVYAAGYFTSIGGQPRNYIAAINAATGAATSWDPNANNNVAALALSSDGTTVYAGGDFTSMGGQARSCIAAIDATTGLATTWNPNAGGTYNGVNALAVSGTTIYAGGAFSTIGGQNRNSIAAIDATTGLATSWNPNAGGTYPFVHALAVSGSTIYAGGHFTSIGGQPRNYIAALDATTGQANYWDPNAWFDDYPCVWALAVSGTTVYAGGRFTTIGGASRPYFAQFDDAPPPTITSITPPSATQGWTGDVTITGANTHFDGTSTVGFGGGITVSTVTPYGNTVLIAQVSVPRSAPAGYRTVTVDTGAEHVSLANAFSVVQAPPTSKIKAWPTQYNGQATNWYPKVGYSVEFRGTVVDSNGNPAKQATVTVDDPVQKVCASVQTNSGGEFRYAPLAETYGRVGNFLFVFRSEGAVAKLVANVSSSDFDTSGERSEYGTGENLDFYNPTDQVLGVQVTATVGDKTFTANTKVAPGKTARVIEKDAGGKGPGRTITSTRYLTREGEWKVPVVGEKFNAVLDENYHLVGYKVGEQVSLEQKLDSNGIVENTFSGDAGSFTGKLSWSQSEGGSLAVGVKVGDKKLKTYADALVGVGRDGMYTEMNGITPIYEAHYKVVWAPAEVTGPAKRHYFAEGYTFPGFDTWLALQNPVDVSVPIKIHYYLGGSQEPVVRELTLTPKSRTTVYVNDPSPNGFGVGPNQEVSIEVESPVSIVAERPMYFSRKFDGAHECNGGHCSMGTNLPKKEHYFAEGTTREGFYTYVCLMNPGEKDTVATVTCMLDDGSNKDFNINVAAGHRSTMPLNDLLGKGKDFSIKVVSNEDIVVERPMYFYYTPSQSENLGSGPWTGGSSVVGKLLSNQSYFVEGNNRKGFEEWLCFQNPNNQSVNIDLTYINNNGKTATQSFSVDAKRRKTIDAYQFVENTWGLEQDFSVYVKVRGDSSISVERSIYFNYHGSIDGGHSVRGFYTDGAKWFYAEGSTYQRSPDRPLSPVFDEWLCILNVNDYEVPVTITYMDTAGQTASKDYSIPPHSRKTVDVNSDVGPNRELSVKVEGKNPGDTVVVERVMYFTYLGTGTSENQDWTGGSCVIEGCW